MQVHDEPAMDFSGVALPPRTWIELDNDELAMAVRHFAESNGIAVPNGRVHLTQRDHRTITGVAMVVEREGRAQT